MNHGWDWSVYMLPCYIRNAYTFQDMYFLQPFKGFWLAWRRVAPKRLLNALHLWVHLPCSNSRFYLASNGMFLWNSNHFRENSLVCWLCNGKCSVQCSRQLSRFWRPSDAVSSCHVLQVWLNKLLSYWHNNMDKDLLCVDAQSENMLFKILLICFKDIKAAIVGQKLTVFDSLVSDLSCFLCSSRQQFLGKMF